MSDGGGKLITSTSTGREKERTQFRSTLKNRMHFPTMERVKTALSEGCAFKSRSHLLCCLKRNTREKQTSSKVNMNEQQQLTAKTRVSARRQLMSPETRCVSVTHGSNYAVIHLSRNVQTISTSRSDGECLPQSTQKSWNEYRIARAQRQ